MTEEGTITRFSPSLIVALRRCSLATYKRRTRPREGSDPASNPVARLGNAAHRVLQWIANEAPELAVDPSAEGRIRARWEAEAQAETVAAQLHSSEAAFGPIHRWPRFTMIQESLVVDGAALAMELAPIPIERRWAERLASTSQQDLYGTIDLVIVQEDRTATVIDHKAGAVHEADVAPGGRYHVQVLLYACMVRDLGVTPVRAEIRPLGRAPIEIPVTDTAMDEAYRIARADVDRYNVIVEDGDVIASASPSQEACQWCEFLLDCPAVWSGRNVDLGELYNVEGTILELQDDGRGRIALRLEMHDGTTALVRGLSTSQVPALATFAAGDEIRIVGLVRSSPASYRRGAGRLDAALTRHLDQRSDGGGSTERLASWRDDGD